MKVNGRRKEIVVDAEGRLVLADGLFYARSPDKLLCLDLRAH